VTWSRAAFVAMARITLPKTEPAGARLARRDDPAGTHEFLERPPESPLWNLRPEPQLGPRRTSASELSRVKSEQATNRLTLTAIVPYQLPEGSHSVPNNTSGSGIRTSKEVADYLRVMEMTVYRLAAAKKIPAFKVGGTWRFRATDIDGWIADQSKKAEGTD
jgi:excisionase family DNA binding protein